MHESETRRVSRPAADRIVRRAAMVGGLWVAMLATPVPAAEPRPGAAATGRNTLVDLTIELDALKAEIRSLKGQLEVQAYDIKRLREREREVTEDFDRRLRELERGGGATGRTAAPTVGAPSASAAPSAGKTSTAATGATATAAVVSPATEQQEYDAAFALIKQGYYDRAAKAFQQFIAKYPNSTLADNAQYWVGETSYVVRNFRGAIDEYNKVIERYPNSDKAPDALLKIGYSQYELGQLDKARVTLSQVIARYPNTGVAKSAQLRLSKMKP